MRGERQTIRHEPRADLATKTLFRTFAALVVALSGTACNSYEVIPSIFKQAASKPAPVTAVPTFRSPSRVAPPPPATPAREESEQVEATVEPVRDLAGELRAAFGNPVQCMSPGSVEGETATMRLSVVVTNAGRVTRATVSAPVERDTTRCLREHAERLMLAGPIEGAPRTIAASVPLVAPPAPAEPDGERRLGPGFAPPAAVLPARGDGSRDTNFVAPADTLPATAPAKRPTGFVAPQHTLPARGQTGTSSSNSSY